MCKTQEAGIAQLVEHLICNQGVGGSSPSAGTNKISDLDLNPSGTSRSSNHIVSSTGPARMTVSSA